ncbi:AbrB/MazE/SpoVT family DNA-binding domain-containing protein [Microcystis aeruginosa]|nr:AbrB/MazE/SpoVT family DNA-binding domain-containing protein [Microcystis aeruginosa]
MKISPNGQITIPPDIQEKLGLLPGTEIQLEVIGDILQIRKPRTLSRGKQLIAAIRGKATSRLTTNDIIENFGSETPSFYDGFTVKYEHRLRNIC